MWQRAQTLYLFLATMLSAVLLFCNMAAEYGGDGEVIQYYRYTSSIPYIILIALAAGLNLLALSTFKVRVFQMRTAGLAGIIALTLQIWLLVDIIYTKDVRVFRFTAMFPIVVSILDVMAYRGILADQLLVESVSRLRSRKKNRKI